MKFFGILFLALAVASKRRGNKFQTLSDEQKAKMKERIERHRAHMEKIMPCYKELGEVKNTSNKRVLHKSYLQICGLNKGFFDNCEAKTNENRKHTCEKAGPHARELKEKLVALESSVCLNLFESGDVCTPGKKRPSKSRKTDKKPAEPSTQEVATTQQDSKEAPEAKQPQDTQQGAQNQGGPGRMGKYHPGNKGKKKALKKKGKGGKKAAG